MKFDFGEVLERMWKIGWNHKVLWLFQMLPGAAMLLVFPLFFLANPASAMFLPEPYNQWANEPWMVGLSVGMMFLLFIPSMFVGAFAQAATTLGAIKVEKGAERLSFRELSRESMPFLLRVMGLYLLFGALWFLVIMVFMLLMMGVAFVTMGIGMLCIMPFFFLIYPIAFVGYLALELAQAGIIADNLGMKDSITRGWQLFRSNALALSVLMFILYFGLTTLSSLFIFPMMLPMMSLPFSMDSSGNFNETFFTFIMVLFPILMVVMFVVQGILMAFFQSAWAVAYLRLTRAADAPVILPEANA